MQPNKINIYQAKLSLRQCWSAVSLIGDMRGHPTCITGPGGSFSPVYLRSSHYICMSLPIIVVLLQVIFCSLPIPPLWQVYSQYVTVPGWMPLPGLSWLCNALSCSSWPYWQLKHLPPSSSLIFVDVLRLLLLHASH